MAPLRMDGHTNGTHPTPVDTEGGPLYELVK